jgi:hypothetical protein
MTQAEDNKKIDIFKWAITIIVTLILGLSSMNAIMLNNIRTVQSVQASELVRIKAVQDINSANILLLNNRVSAIEAEKISEVKQWCLDTFVQKIK